MTGSKGQHLPLLKWREPSLRGKEGHGSLASLIDSGLLREHLLWVRAVLVAGDTAPSKLIGCCSRGLMWAIQKVRK